ncbi:MAG: OsmC family peroxiredoxin [Planctomycetota bacterium]|nr:MAG: OsmC family peroxiredoxin [Planctomycetota bacterium]
MTVEIEIAYQGGLRCRAVHGPSGTTLLTDAPVDNCGRGESFSPTDLVATALGACMLTIMGIVAERHGIDLSGATVRVEKHMAAAPRRRIAALPVTIQVPGPIGEEDRRRLEYAARTCPVHASLGETIERPIRFVWGG